MSVTQSPSAAGTPAIEVGDLVKTYPGGVKALNGLSFSVEAGTVFGLLGPNGAGKSTTIKILTTLSAPDSGEARIAGIDVRRDAQRVRSIFGCVAQKSGVDHPATGRENLTLQGQLYGMRGPELKKRVSTLLERFQLAAVADKLTRTYSGGMQRKLDIAMGLVHQPRVLFLDEPTTGLDPEARTNLWTEIARLAREDGITVLLTTHYLDEADRLASRLAIVDRGRIVAEGPPEKLKGELFGDAIHLEFVAAQNEAAIRSALEHLPNITDLRIEGTSVRARVNHGPTALPGMLAAFEAAGLKVDSVTIARPSLDDVYLRHTGRSFAQADQGAAK